MNLQFLLERKDISLTESEYKITSQNGEDGVIVEVISRLGLDLNKLNVMEFGIEYGTEGNLVLIADSTDTRAVFIEGDKNKFERAKAKYKNKYNVFVLNDFVDQHNINKIIDFCFGDSPLDILSIDVDSIDYYIWEAVEKEVRLLVIEYNSVLPPGKRLVSKNTSWNRDDNYGASIEALEYISNKKGYTLIHTDKRGVNAFFINNKYLHLFPEHKEVIINGKQPYRHGKLDLNQFDEI